MKKICITAVILLVLLSGCARKAEAKDLEQQIDRCVADALSEKTTLYRTNKKKYYSYYLPKYLGRRDSSQASDTFVMQNTEVVMTLNASNVIVERYYANNASYGILVNDKALFSKVYTGSSSSTAIFRFAVNVFEIGEEYYLTVRTRYFDFIAHADPACIPDIVRDILRIARNVSVDSDEVILAYSNKQLQDYGTKTYTMFRQNVAEDGTLAEMLTDYFRTYDLEEKEGDSEEDDDVQEDIE